MLKLPHGNLKSSNVLVGPGWQALVVDFGLYGMINRSQVGSALAGYKAPEAAEGGEVSPKCDVYCLGIIILEVVTGKYPSEYVSRGQGGTDVVEWVGWGMQEGREEELLDPEMRTWSSVEEMKGLLRIGAACTERDPRRRVDIREAVRRIERVGEEGRVEDAESTATEASYKSWGGEQGRPTRGG